MPAGLSRRFRIRPSRPYSLERTAARFLRFPEAVDRFEGGHYRRLLPIGGQLVLVSAWQTGPPSRAWLEVELRGAHGAAPGIRAAAELMLERVLGLHLPIQAFYRLARRDPLLAAATRRSYGLSIAGTAGPWEALVTALFAQQINLALAYRIRRDLAVRYGPRRRLGGREYVAFPLPERIARIRLATLRGLGLSAAKAATLLRLARAFRSGALSEVELAALEDEVAIATLTRIKGVGRWTAETTLLRGLARVDAFPGGDLGVVKYLALGLLGRRTPASEHAMRDYAERWRPYRALALIYAYAELAHRRETAGAG